MRSRSSTSQPVRNLLLGAVIGAGLGGLFLLIGLARFAIYLLSGHGAQPVSAADARMMAVYIGGFALAGAFVGLLRPLLRGRAAIYAAMAAGGAIVMNTIAVGDQGLMGVDRVDVFAMTLMGALFGIAAAYGYLRGS